MRLIIEASSDRSSIALMHGAEALAERSWPLDRRRSQQVFEELPLLLAEAGIGFDGLSSVVAGCGPGNYSGMRLAVTAARSLALALGIPAHGLSSGEALALQALREHELNSVMVVGDARRRHIWYARFHLEGALPVMEGDWALAPYEEAGLRAEGVQRVLSPDHARLAEQLPELEAGEAAVCPSAAWLGTLAAWRDEAGRLDDAACRPIYLHAPVDARVLKSPE